MCKFYIRLICLCLPLMANASGETASDTAPAPTLAAAKVTGGVIISVASCDSDSPCGVVSDTSKKVLDAVNKGVPQNQTMNLIQAVVAPQFDFNLMTRYALGNNWKIATPDQQQQLVDLFRQLLIYTYSSALSKFKGAQITITSNNIIDTKKAQVVSQVILPNSTSNSQPVKVEYDLARTSASVAWRAYDIKIENTSLVTTYRNQFNDVVQTSKIEGLIKQLQTKVNSFKAKSA